MIRIRLGTAAVLLGLVLAGCAGTRSESVRAPADVVGLVDLLTANDLDAVAFDGVSLLLKRDWLQVLVFVEDDGESLLAVFPHTGRSAPVDPDRVAGWNASRRFARAYIDDDGRPVLASDLLLTDGVAPSVVVDWCRLTLDMAAVFAREVWPVPVPLPDPPNE